jgi:hypothetical protein
MFALLSYQRRDRALRVEVANPKGETLAQVKHVLPHAECLNLWRLIVVTAPWLWALKTPTMTAARRFNLFSLVVPRWQQ